MNLGALDNAAFVVGFPIIGSVLQCLLLPFVFDSPVSLGRIKNISQNDEMKNILHEYSKSEFSIPYQASQRNFEKSRRASEFYGIPAVEESSIDIDSSNTTRSESQNFIHLIRDPLFHKPLIVCCIMMMIGNEVCDRVIINNEF